MVVVGPVAVPVFMLLEMLNRVPVRDTGRHVDVLPVCYHDDDDQSPLPPVLVVESVLYKVCDT